MKQIRITDIEQLITSIHNPRASTNEQLLDRLLWIVVNHDCVDKELLTEAAIIKNIIIARMRGDK